jgi:hypothetical protein
MKKEWFALHERILSGGQPSPPWYSY